MTDQANETRGEATITFEGVDYGMRPSWQVIDAVEQSLGKSLEELATGAYDNKLTRDEKATIIGALIREWGKQTGDTTAAGVNDRRIKELIAEEGSLIIGKKLGLLLYTAVTGGLTSTGEAKPVVTTTAKPSPAPKDGDATQE